MIHIYEATENRFIEAAAESFFLLKNLYNTLPVYNPSYRLIGCYHSARRHSL